MRILLHSHVQLTHTAVRLRLYAYAYALHAYAEYPQSCMHAQNNTAAPEAPPSVTR